MIVWALVALPTGRAPISFPQACCPERTRQRSGWAERASRLGTAPGFPSEDLRRALVAKRVQSGHVGIMGAIAQGKPLRYAGGGVSNPVRSVERHRRVLGLFVPQPKPHTLDAQRTEENRLRSQD